MPGRSGEMISNDQYIFNAAREIKSTQTISIGAVDLMFTSSALMSGFDFHDASVTLFNSFSYQMSLSRAS